MTSKCVFVLRKEIVMNYLGRCNKHTEETNYTNFISFYYTFVGHHQRRRNSSPLSCKDLHSEKYSNRGRRSSNACIQTPIFPLLKVYILDCMNTNVLLPNIYIALKPLFLLRNTQLQ